MQSGSGEAYEQVVREVRCGVERAQQARAFCWGIEDVHAGVAVVNGDLEGLWSEVDEPRGLPEVIVDHGGYFPGRVPVYGPGQCGVEVGEVGGDARAGPEEGVSAVEDELMLAAVAGIGIRAGGVAVEPVVLDDPAFRVCPDPFGVAEECGGVVVAVEGVLTAVHEPGVPFLGVLGVGAGGVAASGGAVDGADEEFFVVAGKVHEVVGVVQGADFGEEGRGVVAGVDDVAEQDQVVGFGWGVVEDKTEAAEAAVQVGDGDRWEMVVWHGFTVGVQRVWSCGIFVVWQDREGCFW